MKSLKHKILEDSIRCYQEEPFFRIIKDCAFVRNRLPRYEDTGELFIPMLDKCWVLGYNDAYICALEGDLVYVKDENTWINQNKSLRCLNNSKFYSNADAVIRMNDFRKWF